MGTEALGRGLSQAVDNIAEIRGRDMARAARAELAGLEVKLNDLELKLIHDPVTGARAKKGRDALGLANQYLPQFDEEAKKLRGAVSNDVVGAAFDELLARRRGSLAEGLTTYSAGEAERYYDTEAKAQIDSFVGLAGKYYDDPKRVEEAKARVEWSINDMAERKGLGPEAREQAVLAGRSAVNRAQIQGLLADGRYAEANKAFLGAELTAEDRAALDSAVRTGVIRSEARSKADEIIGSGGGVTAWREAVKGIEDPDVRAQVKSYIDEEWRDREAIRTQAERDATNAAANYIDAGKEVPADIWAAVPGSSKSGLRAVKRARDRGEDIATDPNAYDEIYRGLSSTDPAVRAEWLRRDLRQYWGRLDATDREMFTRMQVAAGNPMSPENQKLLTGIQTKAQVVNQALAGMSLPTTSASNKGTGEHEEAGKFRREVDRRVQAWQLQTGREATVDEVQKIVDGLTIEVAVPGMWTTTDKRLYQLEIADVPASDRRDIEQALRSNGLEVTDDRILEAYQRGRMGD
jgi:hypothetical protein